MTSYQKRLDDIKYYKLRGKQLEDIIVKMMAYMKSNNLTPHLPLGSACAGDEVLTDISSGEWSWNMTRRHG